MRKGFIDDATDFLKKQCITDPSDFLKVDNIIRKLNERASTVRNDKTSAGRLQELNKECLKSIEDVLKEVKWNNYI